ncbi:hypothetical protein OG735_01315 [Streptomyces sp. NBC_01210]|uniref:hypothetical protein n=1 Tax=Streptomyces sp. NBC_01210 TaxID=2903774 RepID=UPI002E154057|nr:hypothetical protein OG735_01315 [Streptomyces sp. NBC_01210]
MTASPPSPLPINALRGFTACFLAQMDAEAAIHQAEGARAAAERARQEGLLAVDHALAAVAGFPATLALVLDGSSFRGYPTAADGDGRQIPPSAAADLGEGLWLHHTRVAASAIAPTRDVTTLVAPHAVDGYQLIAISDDASLARALIGLGLHHGRGCSEAFIPRQR